MKLQAIRFPAYLRRLVCVPPGQKLLETGSYDRAEILDSFDMFPGEINRLVKEKDADLEKYDHGREELQKRLAQLERDMQLALTQEKQAHEEDVDRLSREKVKISDNRMI